MSKKVLIVDDQAGVRYLLDVMLHEDGHEVHSADNGLTAIEMVQEINPDLVIMDVRMPIMDGLSALEKMREIKPDVNVILMTAYTELPNLEKATEYKAQCLYKPFDLNDLRKLMQDCFMAQQSSFA